ncbi:MAG: hypothetical protein Q8Q52_08000 [Acidimicrobiia bacterium]|nr:hypothetical protein [Acidimicrobiia bacterium]
MEVVEFEEDRAMGVVIHDGDTESSGRVTFGSSGPERTTITISVDMPWLDDSAAAARLTSLIERNQIRPPFRSLPRVARPGYRRSPPTHSLR